LIPVVAFIGQKNSGKTYIIQKVIPELAKAGITAGYIKECHEDNVTQVCILQNDFTEEPAEACLFSSNKVITIRTNKDISLSYIIFKFFSHVDVVLAEGFSSVKNIPKFEVARRIASTELDGRTIPGVRAVISDFNPRFEPQYSFEQPAEIAQFIMNTFLRLEEEDSIEVYADGKRLRGGVGKAETYMWYVEHFPIPPQRSRSDFLRRHQD